MQFRNRMIALLLALTSLLLLTACGDILQAITLTPMPTAMLTPTATVTPTLTPIPTPDPDTSPITFGLSTGTSYRNEHFNIALDVNDRWFINTTSQYNLENGFSAQLPDEQREPLYLEYLSSGAPVEDYYAVLHSGLKEITIEINLIAPMKEIFPDATSLQEAIAQDIRESFKQDGTQIEVDSISNITIAGQQASCWNFSYAGDGYQIYTAQISIWRGDYNIGILLSSIGEDALQEMIAMFHTMN